MTKKKLFFFVSVIYQLSIYTLFLFKKEWGLGFLFFESFHLLPFILFAKKRSLPTVLKTGIAILLAAFFSIRSGSGNPVSILTLFFLNPIIAFEFASGELFSLQTFLTAPQRIGKNVNKTIQSIASSLDFILPFLNAKKLTSSKYFSKIIVGTFISAPVILILLGLFQDVDAKFVPTLWENFLRIIPDWIEKFRIENFSSTIIEYSMFLLYLFFVFPVKQHEESLQVEKTYVIELITMNFLVASIFFLFFSSQIQTFTQMISDFQLKQVNPKLFVREGFYQLLFASLIGTGVSLLLNSQQLYQIAKKKKMIAIAAMTILLLGVVLVSLLAGQRVFVYQYLHGLTVLRIWGMLLLAAFWVALLSLLLHIYQRIQFSWFLQTVLFSFLTVLSIIQVMNIDYVVAKWGNPRVNDKTDWRYISRLSFDALPVWKERIDHISPEILGKCRPDYVTNGKNNPQFPQGFPNTDVGIVECQEIIQKHQEEAVLAEELLGRIGYHIYFSPDQNIRADIQPDDFLSCEQSKLTVWQSTNLSKLNGKKFLCENKSNWEGFYQEYTDLQVILFYATHKQEG